MCRMARSKAHFLSEDASGDPAKFNSKPIFSGVSDGLLLEVPSQPEPTTIRPITTTNKTAHSFIASPRFRNFGQPTAISRACRVGMV